MSSNNLVNSSESENTCVVCFKDTDIYSIGVCDHPVCFECSTRMRVLCKQNECPICRQELPKVIFIKEVELFASLKPKVENSNLQDRKVGVYFCSPTIQRAYYRLLEHNCFKCRKHDREGHFRTFQQLKDHMRREHELFYCDLCVLHLRIFTFERKCYTRGELGQHRRKGDVDNTSHRGHPLCEFCDTRFMDNDELFRHLRRDHLYCHFCDADGKHQYYNSYEDLRKHYLHEHYLCEEGDCKHEQFTSVFRTEIDFKGHVAAVHGRFMSKAASRQARTLELEFTLAPRPTRQYNQRRNEREEEEGAVGYDTYFVEPGGPPPTREALRSQDFPSLGNVDATPRTVSNVTITSKMNPLSEENFPSLGATGPPRSSAVTITTSKFSSSARPVSSGLTVTRTMRGSQALEKNLENFPVLRDNVGASGTSSVRVSVNNDRPSKAPNVSIHVNQKSDGAITTRITTNPTPQPMQVRPKSNDFPALRSSPIPEPQWVASKAKKQQQEPKPSKVAAAPVLPPSGLHDFPSLHRRFDHKPKKSSSVTMPVPGTWVNLNNFNDAKKAENNRLKEKQQIDAKANENQSKAKVDELRDNEGRGKGKKKKGRGAASGDPEVDERNNENETGQVKKRSELNIGALKISEPKTVELVVGKKSKPPPGFSAKPPPGLHTFAAPSSDFPNLISYSNDLTFTSSSGQSYSIISSQFYPPVNFNVRNRALIEKFKSILQSNEAINQFKVYSDMFRNDSIPADKYYEHCQHVMRNDFEVLFPELLVLLPDVKKQQQLHKIHVTEGSRRGNLEVCATCKQVVLTADLRNHLTNHTLDNHFPILGQTSEVSNVWRK